MKSRWIAALLLIAALAGCERGDPAASLVGAWRLVSWEQGAEPGNMRRPYGENPEGQLIYTSNGQMAAQLMNPGATLPDVTGSAAEEVLAQVSTTFFAYYGTYSVDASAQTVTHHVQGSLAPTWVRSDQVRAFEFLDEDRLQLTAILDEQSSSELAATGRQVLVWERIR